MGVPRSMDSVVVTLRTSHDAMSTSVSFEQPENMPLILMVLPVSHSASPSNAARPLQLENISVMSITLPMPHRLTSRRVSFLHPWNMLYAAHRLVSRQSAMSSMASFEQP